MEHLGLKTIATQEIEVMNTSRRVQACAFGIRASKMNTPQEQTWDLTNEYVGLTENTCVFNQTTCNEYELKKGMKT